MSQLMIAFFAITKNPKDFEQLCDRNPHHPGLFAIYQDNDRSRDMTAHGICRAIRNLVGAGVQIPGQVHVLNHWRY